MIEPKLKACSARVCDYPCLPLDRGLTVAIVPATEWVPTGAYRERTPVCDPRPALVLRVTHHSGLGVRGHAGLDWPASVAGLASAKRAMAALLAEPIDWTAGADALAERCASAGQSAECVAAIVRAEQDAFVTAGGRLIRTTPLASEPLPEPGAWVFFVRYDRGWTRLTSTEPFAVDVRRLARAAAVNDQRTERIDLNVVDLPDVDPHAWERCPLPALTGPYTRSTVTASLSLLDFGIVDGTRIVFVMHDPTAWEAVVNELCETAEAHDENHYSTEDLPDYRRMFGTWSKGVKMGEIRWPSRYSPDERRAKQAEQDASDKARADLHQQRAQVYWLSHGVFDVAPLLLVPCADPNESERRSLALEHAERLVNRLTAKLFVTRRALGYPQGSAHETALKALAATVRQAQALHDDVDAHGFGPGTSCDVAPSRYPYPGENAPANPVAVLTVAFDSIDGHALREIVDARGREWTVPRERLQPTKEQP